MTNVIQKSDAVYRYSQLGVFKLAQNLVASFLSFHINNRSSFMVLCVQPLMVKFNCSCDFWNKAFSDQFQEVDQGIGQVVNREILLRDLSDFGVQSGWALHCLYPAIKGRCALLYRVAASWIAAMMGVERPHQAVVSQTRYAAQYVWIFQEMFI
jgi:hypothetical protein